MNQLDEVDSPFMSKTKLHSSDARNGRFCEWESRERKDNLTGARGIGPVDKVTSPSGRFVPYRVALLSENLLDVRLDLWALAAVKE